MMRPVYEQYADNVDTLFPEGCLDIVSNQIKSDWKSQLKEILKGEDPEKLLVKYLPDIERFYEEHSLVIPNDFISEAYIETIP
jgi:hypothetical protein